MDVEEVDDVTIQHAVYDIAYCAAEYERQRPAKQALTSVFFQQVDDEDGSAYPHYCKEVTLPAGLRREEAERCPLVIDQYQIEEGSHRVRFAIDEEAGDGDLGDLIKQDDDGGNA